MKNNEEKRKHRDRTTRLLYDALEGKIKVVDYGKLIEYLRKCKK